MSGHTVMSFAITLFGCLSFILGCINVTREKAFEDKQMCLGNVTLNFLKSSDDHIRAANVSLNSHSRTGFLTVWKYYTVEVLVVNEAYF